MFNRILKNEFIKNSLTLLSGVSIAQFILFAITPVLTRIYSNEIFGVYFLFTSIIVVLKILSSLRLELSIMLPQRDKDAINLFSISIITNVFINAIFLLIIIIFNVYLNKLMGVKNLGKYIYLVPFATFFVGISESFGYWNNRKKYYINISASKISKSSFQGIWNLSFGFSNLQYLGLIPAYIFGFFASSIVLIYKSLNELVLLSKYISIKRMLYLLKKYKDIPFLNTLISLTVNISNEAPILLMSNFFGVATVGLYGMANKLIAVPTDIVGRSVGQVFFQRASEKNSRNENLHDLLKKTIVNLLKVALLLFIPALIVSPLLKYILGIEWEMTGYFAILIIPYLFTKFLFVPISSIYTILNKQKQMALLFLLSLILKIFAIYIGFKVFDSALIAVGLFSLFGVIFNLFLIGLFLKMSKRVELYKY